MNLTPSSGATRSQAPLPHGSFGENLTTPNWLEDRVHLGDRYRIGTATVMVTIPRKPCYKLNMRLGRDDVLPKYLESKRTGFYLAVVEAGEIGAGDVIDLLESHPLGITPRGIVDPYLGHARDPELLERALSLEFVTDRMRKASPSGLSVLFTMSGRATSFDTVLALAQDQQSPELRPPFIHCQFC